MIVTVKLFALLRDRAGVSQTTLHLATGARVAQAIEQLARQVPSVQPYLSRLAYAVNEHYMPTTTELQDGDELALIPPVSGG